MLSQLNQYQRTQVLSAPMAVTFTPNDVRSLPRLPGSDDVDVVEVLSQLRLVVDFWAKAVAPHDENLRITLHLNTCLSSAMVLVLRCTKYQQRMSGRIDWRAKRCQRREYK